jgi:hypothetical protein
MIENSSMRNQLKWGSAPPQAKRWNKLCGVISTLILFQHGISPVSARTVPQQSSTETTSQPIKVRLGISGIDNEWIRFDRNPETGVLNIYHTTRIRQALLSDVATGLLSAGAGELVGAAIDGYNGPVPIPNLNFYRWSDHPTRRLFFVPDGCLESAPIPGNPAAGCVAAGTNTIALPQNTDIQAGTWTIEYAEEDLVRTITFRIPKT